MEILQYGNVESADFLLNTITFEMQENFMICAGEFAIVKIDTLDQKMKLEEFLETLK